ncbi:uncharacterized protein LOC134266652 isoform X1 [Saccostrea cucullata]|uniref:uncharacterized protein LOC134266652 isoform X1 n=1 Tax=Saccostrea cuccullata TaxID=36930 RepID=UPI002ED18C37
MCIAYVRSLFMGRSTAQIVIRQLFTNGTKMELSSCRIIGRYRTECSAKLANEGCGRVNVTCSIVRNETEEEKVTKEIYITDEASVGSFHIHYKGMNNDNATQIFPTGSLIKLICRGDVSIVNDEVLENLTFTWNRGFLEFQEPPTVKTSRTFDENCKTNQTVSSFLYLKEEQLDTEIRCEAKGPSRHFLGRRISWKSIRIKTIPERGQMLGPVVVYKDELEERTLLSLTCKTTDFYNSTDTEGIKWCIRKENNTQFVPLPLQEDPLVEIFNSSKERTLKSSVHYQLLKSSENVEIICEANHSNICGSGTIRGKVRFDSHSMERTDFHQNGTCVTCVNSDQPNTLIYVSASVMIASIIILISGVAAFCKARGKVKYETSTSPLNATPDKSNMPKANPYSSVGNNPVSDVHHNQISSGGQTYSNAPIHSEGATTGVYELTDASDNGDMYEPIELHDNEAHIYEGKLQTDEVYEEV